MNTSILQEYLTLQFIPVDDENGVEKLNKSAEQLEKKLRKDKSKIIPFTLVALDPNCPSDNILLIEVQDIIIKNWTVYVNKAGGNNLVTYNRAVMLEALNSLTNDVELAGIIWLTGSSIIKSYSLGREETILLKWLKAIGTTYEAEARKLWAISDITFNMKIDAPILTLPEFKKYETNKVILKKKISSAAGPQYYDEQGVNQASESPTNRYWPGNNNHWAGDFGRSAGEAIANAIDTAVNSSNPAIAISLKETSKLIASYFKEVQPYFDELTSVILNKNNSIDLRSQLLWIKESQFSNCLSSSYRNINKSTLVFAIPIDLAEIIPSIYPVSIDYFAKEIARVSNNEVDNNISIEDVFSLIEKDTKTKDILIQHQSGIGRKNLYSFICSFCRKEVELDSLLYETGIPKDTQLSLSELLTWILHDIQSIKLTNAK